MTSTENPEFAPVPESLLPTGFPSPAQDYLSGRIDLNKALIPNPASTVLMKVRDNTMNLDGICARDEILIDRTGTPHHGSVVVVTVDGGDILIRRLRQTNGRSWLEASNPTFHPLKSQATPTCKSSASPPAPSTGSGSESQRREHVGMDPCTPFFCVVG